MLDYHLKVSGISMVTCMLVMCDKYVSTVKNWILIDRQTYFFYVFMTDPVSAASHAYVVVF